MIVLILFCLGAAVAVGYLLGLAAVVGFAALLLLAGLTGFIHRRFNPVRRRHPRPAAFYQWR